MRVHGGGSWKGMGFMNDFVLSCCSTADLTAEHFAARDIHYICFHYSLNGKQYADDLGKSMPFDQFYQAMADGAETQTSQVNVEEFTAYFTPFLEQGKDILHVTLSSGISGVYNSACVAREELLQKYPDRKIYIVDSLGASSGYGLLMDRLADLRDKGEDVDSVYEWALANRLRLHHWFFSIRSHVLCERRAYFEGVRMVRYGAQYLSAAEYG